MSRYFISVTVESDMGIELVQALAESMVDDSMFAMHEIVEIGVSIDD